MLESGTNNTHNPAYTLTFLRGDNTQGEVVEHEQEGDDEVNNVEQLVEQLLDGIGEEDDNTTTPPPPVYLSSLIVGNSDSEKVLFIHTSSHHRHYLPPLIPTHFTFSTQYTSPHYTNTLSFFVLTLSFTAQPAPSLYVLFSCSFSSQYKQDSDKIAECR